MTTLARSAVRALLAALPLLAAMSTPASAAPNPHLHEDLFNSCASQIDSMPLNGRMPLGRKAAVFHPKNPFAPGPNTCSDLTWVKLKGRIVTVGLSYAGRYLSQAWDCSHSTLSWAFYKKSGSTWQRIGGGASYGNMVEGDGGTCLYDKTGFPQSANWGSFTQSTSDTTEQEYRVAFNAWTHDATGLSHIDKCADPTNCSWPVKILSGDAAATPRQDYTVYRPSDGTFYSLDSVSGVQTNQKWGHNGDVPTPGDFDGDYESDFARARNVNGVKTWYILNTTGGSWWKQWGETADVPLAPGDFDGDGKTDIAVWRPSTGVWYIVNSSTDAWWERQWGASEDKPVIGHFDEDLRTDIAVWRPSNGVWYVQKSLSGIWSDVLWGSPSDVPVPADFDGDNITDHAVWSWEDGTFYWISSKTGAETSYPLGEDGDRPIPGFYDNDLKADYAVYRWDGGLWIYTSSKTGSSTWTQKQWGDSFDIPVVPFRRGT